MTWSRVRLNATRLTLGYFTEPYVADCSEGCPELPSVTASVNTHLLMPCAACQWGPVLGDLASRTDEWQTTTIWSWEASAQSTQGRTLSWSGRKGAPCGEPVRTSVCWGGAVMQRSWRKVAFSSPNLIINFRQRDRFPLFTSLHTWPWPKCCLQGKNSHWIRRQQ